MPELTKIEQSFCHDFQKRQQALSDCMIIIHNGKWQSKSQADFTGKGN